jgi:hypothetical protein
MLLDFSFLWYYPRHAKPRHVMSRHARHAHHACHPRHTHHTRHAASTPLPRHATHGPNGGDEVKENRGRIMTAKSKTILFFLQILEIYIGINKFLTIFFKMFLKVLEKVFLSFMKKYYLALEKNILILFF